MAPQSSPSAQLRTDRGLALGLALAAIGLYARTCLFPWLVLDAALRENPFWGRPGSPLAWGAAWRAGGLGGVTLLLESALGGDSAFLSRAVGVLLHAACTGLLFSALRRLGIARGASALCAALFALHPLRAEAVASLAERSTSLAGLCCALGLWWYSRAASSSSYGAGGARRDARLLLLCAALAALAIALLPARALPGDLGFFTRLSYAPHALGALALRTLWPADLAWFHPHPALIGAGLSAGALALGWFGLGVAAALLWRIRARFSRVAQGGAWFLLLALPQVLFPTGEAALAARWSTLASSGLELALVLGASALLGHFGVAPRVRVVLGAAWVLALAALSWMRLPDWSSERALAERALSVTRDNYRAHDLLGLVLLPQGRLSEAAREHERALAIRPDDALALLHRGEIEIRRGLISGQEEHLVEAQRYLELSLEADADSARAWERLGEVFQRRDEYERARAALERALDLEPARATAQSRLGMMQLALGAVGDALEAFRRVTRLRPDLAEAWCGQGMAHFQADDLDLARFAFAQALALEPDHVESRTTLGRIRTELGDLAGAERDYRHAVGVNPDNVDALFALADLCERTERRDEALRSYERALALRPTHVRANLGLARLALERGEPERALLALETVLRLNPEHAQAKPLLEQARAALRARSGDGDG